MTAYAAGCSLLARVVACCALSMLTAASAWSADPRGDDRDQLKGTWKIVGGEEGGRRLTKEMFEGQTLQFETSTYRVHVSGMQIEEGTFTIDGAKDPKTIDLTIVKGDDQGKVQLGIYEVMSNRLRVCFARPGAKERPVRFKTEPGEERFTLELDRVP